MGIEPTREATNPLQTVLKTARHTSTYLPPGRGETSTSVVLTALKKLYQKSAAVSIPQRSFYTVSDKPFYRILRSEIVRRHSLSARLCNYGNSRIQRVCEPYVAADHAVIAYPGIASEYRGSCVYHYPVSQVRMTLYALYGCAPIVVVSPITTPVPWSIKKYFPIVAPGCMSIPVTS